MKRFLVLLGFVILVGSFAPASAVDFQAIIVNLPSDLTTTHGVPFDITFTISNPGVDAITSVGAIDENDIPIGTITYDGGLSFDWFFEPPCAWITDGLTHTVSFYLEDATQGYVYPDVALYTSTLIVIAGTPPEISGDCGANCLTPVNYTWTFEFEVTNRDENDQIWWTVSPNIMPHGNFELVDGVLTFQPCPEDEIDPFIVFNIRATGCTGQYDECNVICEVASTMIADPNFDHDWNILDAVYIINHLYKDGPLIYPPYADWNWDGRVNILDVVYIINFLYKDGPLAIFPGANECVR